MPVAERTGSGPMRTLFLSLALVGTASCSTNVEPRATGLSIDVRDAGGGDAVRTGELLAVRDSGIVYLVNRSLLFYSPFADGVEVESAPGWPRVRYEGFPDVDDRRMLQWYARYAAGLDDGTLARMLDALEQDSIVRWPAASGGPTRAELEAGAERAAMRFSDSRAASLAGYRPVGPDFPGMGVHWVHVPTLMSRSLDPDRPAVLCYTRFEGRTMLVNVAYAVAVAGDEPPPAIPGIPPELWHVHRGTVADEMLHPHGHDRGRVGPDAESGAGVRMVHVWVVPNPHGVLAQHNWGLPFLRAGLPVPTRVDEAVARFVALGTGAGRAYQLRLVELLIEPEAADEARGAVRAAADEASRWIDDVRSRPGATAAEAHLARAAEGWRTLGRTLEPLVADRDARDALERLHGVRHDLGRRPPAKLPSDLTRPRSSGG